MVERCNPPAADGGYRVAPCNLPPDEKLDAIVALRLTLEEAAMVRQLARIEGLTPSRFLRKRLLIVLRGRT